MESQEEYKNIFNALGAPDNPEVIEKLQKFVLLLRKWNSRINLTASNEWSLIERLLLEGLWAATMYPSGSLSHLDIGSGAGFPALPMCIALPHIRLDMVESRFKRVSFLETAANALNLPQIHVHHGRVGQFLDSSIRKWDCISWKAVKLGMPDIMKICEHAHRDTQFWIFHGNTLAVEDPSALENILKLERREQFPFKLGWMLSIYLPR